MIYVGQAVMVLNGTIYYFVDTVFNYPTLAECYKAATFNGIDLRLGSTNLIQDEQVQG